MNIHEQADAIVAAYEQTHGELNPYGAMARVLHAEMASSGLSTARAFVLAVVLGCGVALMLACVAGWVYCMALLWGG